MMMTILPTMALHGSIPFDLPLAAMAIAAFSVSLIGLGLSLPRAPRANIRRTEIVAVSDRDATAAAAA